MTMKKHPIPYSLAAAGVALIISCSDPSTTGPGPDPGAGPDVTAPEQIVDPVLVYSDAHGDAVLSWTAPRDDANHERVESYEIRYSYTFPLNWEISALVSDPPTPGDPGDDQEYVFSSPQRGRNLYAAIRSHDAMGNASPISNIAHTRIDGFAIEGHCGEAVSRAPIAGLDVEVTAGHVHQLVSDADGRFLVEDLISGVANVSIRSGASGTIFHNYNRTINLVSDTLMNILMIEYEETEIPTGNNVLWLLMEAVEIPRVTTVLKKYRSYPIKCYIPAFEYNGVDLEDAARQAAGNWMARTGHQIFSYVDSPPDTGITVAFKSRDDMNEHIGITHHVNDDQGYPLRDEVDITYEVDTWDQVWLVALHEFGHTIRLSHLPAGYLMHSTFQDMALDITNDEAKVVQLYLALPNGLDMTPYDASDLR